MTGVAAVEERIDDPTGIATDVDTLTPVATGRDEDVRDGVTSSWCQLRVVAPPGVGGVPVR